MILTGTTIKKLRIDAGLTQKQLAKLVSVSQAHIAKIENSKVDPRLSTVNKILRVLTQPEGKKCRDTMTKNVIYVTPKEKVRTASKLMIENAISQLPVIENEKIVGTLTEESIIRNLDTHIAEKKVEEIMEPPLPMVPENTAINIIRLLLEDNPGVLVTKKGEILGIITRTDLLRIFSTNI